MTQWKVISSQPKYEISEFGDVRHIRLGKNRKPFINWDGYRTFGFRRDDGKVRSVDAARLVAEAFIGPKPFDGAEVCHNDGTRTNDHYSNLRWDTRKGNAEDRISHGTEPLGELNGKAVLTEGAITEIRRLASQGERQKYISRLFGVGQSTVSDIVTRKCWAHVA